MKAYDREAFNQLCILVKQEDEDARKWLMENGCRELAEFWDAIDGVEKSFSWLMENGFRPFAAAVDAISGDSKAKVWLLQSGHHEIAAFVEACNGSAAAVKWLVQHKEPGWLMVAKEISQKEKKKEKNFFQRLFSFGNPFGG